MAFSRVYGHERQVAFLNNAIHLNRVAHSYLFHGIAGVGKKTTAMAFAMALNCRGTEAVTGKPCDSCRKADSGNHPDLLRLAPRGMFITIEEIRELAKVMRFRPMEGGRRVVIIEEAHSMNGPAVNALLKTLEEPLPGNVIILVTTQCDSLPATILSRCQKLCFSPLPFHSVESYLRVRLSIDENEARVLAASSGGSIGNALSRDASSCLQLKQDMAGVVRGGEVFTEDDPLAFVSAAERFGEDRKNIIEKLDILKEWFRDVLVYRESGQARLLIHGDMTDATISAARARPTEEILECIEAVQLARRGIERNGNRQLILESMIFKLSCGRLRSEIK